AEGAAEQAAAINAELGESTAFAVKLDVTSEADWVAAMEVAQARMGGLSVLVNNAGIGVRGNIETCTLADWLAAIEFARDVIGGLSVLVNNAGVGIRGNIETCTLADWHRGFAINVDSVFLGCQKALPLMKESQPGSIINISSIAGLIASDTMPGYNASKAAVWMLSKSVALYCAKMGWDIRSNSVHPTFIDTPILDGMAANTGKPKDVIMEKLARQIPLKRVGHPDDIANGVLYLASDESRFMTGAELKLDGGISAM
ncbi:MAG: hypothetical protein RL299_1586, partial [Pseudomonadota bacterium]